MLFLFSFIMKLIFLALFTLLSSRVRSFIFQKSCKITREKERNEEEVPRNAKKIVARWWCRIIFPVTHPRTLCNSIVYKNTKKKKPKIKLSMKMRIWYVNKWEPRAKKKPNPTAQICRDPMSWIRTKQMIFTGMSPKSCYRICNCIGQECKLSIFIKIKT